MFYVCVYMFYIGVYRSVIGFCMVCLLVYRFCIGGWGGEYEVAPTGKSFRFVRACERAGGRRARDQLRLPRGFWQDDRSCGSSCSFSPAVVFSFFGTTANMLCTKPHA